MDRFTFSGLPRWGTDGDVPDCHGDRPLRDGTTYTLNAQKSALLITNGYDGGQTANLDGVAIHKGMAVPLVVIHSTGGAFPRGVEEPAVLESLRSAGN
jgi:hypothetical protein